MHSNTNLNRRYFQIFSCISVMKKCSTSMRQLISLDVLRDFCVTLGQGLLNNLSRQRSYVLRCCESWQLQSLATLKHFCFCSQYLPHLSLDKFDIRCIRFSFSSASHGLANRDFTLLLRLLHLIFGIRIRIESKLRFEMSIPWNPRADWHPILKHHEASRSITKHEARHKETS